MMSLFSSFDSLLYNDILIFNFMILFMFLTYSKILSVKILSNKMISTMKINNKFNMILIYSIVILIWCMNITSLKPYIMTYTSLISFNLTLSLVFWMMFNSFILSKNFKSFFKHLIPEGSPLSLILILFLIELVSIIIRPLTLTLRLLANLVAGHLIMSLIFNFMSHSMSMITNLFLLFIELMVGTIQAYIFLTLLLMYQEEVYGH